MDCGSFEVRKLETGFLVRVRLPMKHEPMYNNSPMGYEPPKEGAVSSTGEVLGLVSQWLEKGDVEFGKEKPKEPDNQTLVGGNGRGLHDTYGQEPKVMG